MSQSQSEKNYAWAEFLDYMEGGGPEVVNIPVKRPLDATAAKPQLAWGILLALALTLAALWVNSLEVWPFTVRTAKGDVSHPIEPVMLAILLGMVIGNVWRMPKTLNPGLKFSVKKFLPLGIVLLGVRLHFIKMLKVGFTGLVLSGMETVVALLLLWVLARWLRLPQKLGTLLAVGTAICGGTAIVATAPVIEAEEKDVAYSVATVTLLGLLAMILLPILGHVLDLSSKQFGVWAGLAIHQTPQVIAAGYSYSPNDAPYSPEAGDTATIVKLARVCLLAPVVFIIGLVYARNKALKTNSSTVNKINYLNLFPKFVIGFMAMALLNTLNLIPELTVHDVSFLQPGPHTYSVAAAAEWVSKFCIVMSMAAVGLETRVAAMRQTGLKAFGASLAAVLVIAVLVLVAIKTLSL